MERDSIITADKPEVARREVTSPDPRDSEDLHGPLLAQDASTDMRSRWTSIQAAFVDDPRSAVQKADELVASAIQRLSETFTSERAQLERHWSQGKDVSTEDLRLALRRYRAFFDRLLAV